jgi:hypothetical protein
VIGSIEGEMPNGAEPHLHNWTDYLLAWDKVTSPIYTRGILINEILIDPDSENWHDVRDGIRKLHLFFKKMIFRI